MSYYLRLSFRFFDARFHGRGDAGQLEWPPSPLRAFQAIVAAAGQRWRKAQIFDTYAREPLAWLESLGSPEVIAPTGVLSSVSYRLYVPNNHADIVAADWSVGNHLASIAEHRVEKDVRSTRLTGGDTVHYLWAVPSDEIEHLLVLNAIAREVSHLGWGVDQAGASFNISTSKEIDRLVGERWRPVQQGGITARVPQPSGPTTPGTLADLRRKHAEFVARLGSDGLRPVPPLTAFDTVGYQRDTEPAGRPFVAFRIASVNPDDTNPSFDTARRCRDVAAWVRHATGVVCEGWPFPNFGWFVHGHDENGNQTTGERADERFMYLPLPTINHALGRVEAIRRVLIAVPPGFQDRIDWIRRRLPGQELVWDSDVKGLLNTLPDSDWVLGRYIAESQVWSTVSPVVLPGFDDRDAETAERLLRRAFGHAGFSEEVVRSLELEWRNVGFRAGVDLASRYCLPDRLHGPRYHVRVRFTHPIRGPLAVGAGRYRGMGLFASSSD